MAEALEDDVDERRASAHARAVNIKAGGTA
jgi:hypothetical protein